MPDSIYNVLQKRTEPAPCGEGPGILHAIPNLFYDVQGPPMNENMKLIYKNSKYQFVWSLLAITIGISSSIVTISHFILGYNLLYVLVSVPVTGFLAMTYLIKWENNAASTYIYLLMVLNLSILILLYIAS